MITGHKVRIERVIHRIGGLENYVADPLADKSCYTPHRWLRNSATLKSIPDSCYTPHRWLRNEAGNNRLAQRSYTPHRWLRNVSSLYKQP